MWKVILTIGLFGLATLNATAQKSADGEKRTYPTVFQIGELPTAFEELGDAYDKALIDVYDADVKKAYRQWSLLLKAMEKHAENNHYDLRGVKMWLKVFWNKDGSIDYIAFHLKPTSKNVDKKALTAFLNSFIKSYEGKLDVSSRANFSQYSSAAFPTLPDLY